MEAKDDLTLQTQELWESLSLVQVMAVQEAARFLLLGCTAQSERHVLQQVWSSGCAPCCGLLSDRCMRHSSVWWLYQHTPVDCQGVGTHEWNWCVLDRLTVYTKTLELPLSGTD